MIELPWITRDAQLFLQQIVRNNFRALEFGAGRSTLWFSHQVAELVSVEHNPEWYEEVIRKVSPGTVRLHASPHIVGTDHLQKPYSFICDEFPDDYFDLVFIDGRDRISCVEKSRRVLKPGGYMCIDNMD